MAAEPQCIKEPLCTYDIFTGTRSICAYSNTIHIHRKNGEPIASLKMIENTNYHPVIFVATDCSSNALCLGRAHGSLQQKLCNILDKQLTAGDLIPEQEDAEISIHCFTFNKFRELEQEIENEIALGIVSETKSWPAAELVIRFGRNQESIDIATECMKVLSDYKTIISARTTDAGVKQFRDKENIRFNRAIESIKNGY